VIGSILCREVFRSKFIQKCYAYILSMYLDSKEYKVMFIWTWANLPLLG